jgi:hypothetical protein
LKQAVFIIISVTFAMLLSSLLSNAAGANSVIIFSPVSNPYGLSYEQHVENFWKHIASIPQDKNPWNDTNGVNCDSGQSNTNSSVFYLSGNGGGKAVRTCEVPAGKGLFIPVSPMEISDKEAPNTSFEQLHKIAKRDQDSVTSLNLKIDDKQYNRQDLSKYRIPTKDFYVVFPKNAVFGVRSEGISKAVGDGYYVITEPLAKGNHTVAYSSSLICPGTECIEPNFAQELTYNLIVK